MNFLVITNAPTLIEDSTYVAYAPYVYEMDIWFEKVEKVSILSPTSYNKRLLTSPFKNQNINLISIPELDFTSLKKIVKSIFLLPVIIFRLFKSIKKADHIHLRCPGNIGLLGCIVQIFFPKKPKTVKYAGNWDPNSKQPFSYKLQKKIISNTFLTKNCKVLVYGEWKNQTKNIIPFFTASYTKSEIEEIAIKNFKDKISFIYVGAFSKGKQPLLSVKTIQKLKTEGFNVHLDMFGNGSEFKNIQEYISKNKLEDTVTLHGNQSKEIVKEAFKKAHFLIFISKSEGWPKVVAEAMFWSCLPISTSVSCVPYMLDNSSRGILVNENIDEIIAKIKVLLKDEELYLEKVESAKKWSQRYTLDKFSKEIEKLLLNE